MADQHASVRNCLERYYSELAYLAAAQAAHARAEADLKATGAVLNTHEFTQGVAARMRIVLPTESPISDARGRVNRAWSDLETTLRQSGLVLRDMADALGIRE